MPYLKQNGSLGPRVDVQNNDIKLRKKIINNVFTHRKHNCLHRKIKEKNRQILSWQSFLASLHCAATCHLFTVLALRLLSQLNHHHKF